jgi:hypothetical protein
MVTQAAHAHAGPIQKNSDLPQGPNGPSRAHSLHQTAHAEGRQAMMNPYSSAPGRWQCRALVSSQSLRPYGAGRSEHALAPDRAGRQRGSPRHCPPQDGDEGVLEIARSKEAGRDALCASEDASRLRTHAAARPFRCARRVPSRRHRSKPQDYGSAPARTTA